MKKDKIRTFTIEFVLLIILSLALFVPNIITRKILALFLTLFAIIVVILIKRKVIKSIYNKQVFWLMIGFGVIYLTVFYLMGLYFGYYEAAAKFSFKTIKDFIIPLVLIIVTSEIIRFLLIGQKWKLSKILVLINMVLVDLVVYISVYDLTNFDDMLAVIGFIFFASIACNLLYDYISVRYGCNGIIVYRLITVLFVYIIPYIPDVYIFFRSFLRMVYPYLIYLTLEYTYSKTNYATAYRDRKKNVITTTILLVTMTMIIALVSCRFTYGVLVIGSGSMTGTIDKGDAVIFKSYKGGSLKEGDIIIYIKEDIKTVHRIVKMENVNGEYRYFTKGDKNKEIDNGYRVKKDIVGVTIFKIKYIGYPTLWLRDIFEDINE